MITFEEILPTLNELFIEKLPLYIEEINKEHNDGFILRPFENKTLFENCQKLPSFKFELLEAEYSDKDRIIENTVFDFKIEIKTGKTAEINIILLCRYAEAINVMIEETVLESFINEMKITKIYNDNIYFRLKLED